ncbi:MAG: ABC transporter permease [Trueperaceae bacterium]|nr:ABC transporter permease [Trueperaceae bacterium]
MTPTFGQERRRQIAAVVRKDLRVALSSKAVWMPLLIVPLIFIVILPLAVALVAPQAAKEGADVMREFEGFSPTLLESVAGLTDPQKVVVIFLGYIMAPLFLVLPVMFASVLAADSFAGEKERKTIEALVYSPISDRDLVLAKMLSAWLPAVVVGAVAFIVYCLTANLAAWPVMGRVFLPTWLWGVLIVWVMPAMAAVALGATVMVSARANTFQEAYQLGAVVVLPLIAMVVAQATGVIYLSVWLVVALGAVLWVIAAVLVRLGGQRFRRARIMGSV